MISRGYYPNPFTGSNGIAVTLRNASNVNLKVNDLLGRQVLDVPSQSYSVGETKMVFELLFY